MCRGLKRWFARFYDRERFLAGLRHEQGGQIRCDEELIRFLRDGSANASTTDWARIREKVPFQLQGASLTPAMTPHIRCSDLRGADLRGRDLQSADFDSCNLSGADLTGARLGGGCRFSGASLRGACLHSVLCIDQELSGADLRGAFGLSGVRRIRFTSTQRGEGQPNRVESDPPIFYDNQPSRWRAWLAKCSSWESLRVVDQLSVLRLTWIGLFFTWLWSICAFILNKQIVALREAAANLHQEMIPSWLAHLLRGLQHVPVLPISGWTFAALLLLALGSLLYVLYCPIEVREYSLLRWVASRPNDRLEYLDLRHGRPVSRGIIWICLVSGGPS